jgi:hypothetical protein
MALQGAPYVYDISRLRVKGLREVYRLRLSDDRVVGKIFGTKRKYTKACENCNYVTVFAFNHLLADVEYMVVPNNVSKWQMGFNSPLKV